MYFLPVRGRNRFSNSRSAATVTIPVGPAETHVFSHTHPRSTWSNKTTGTVRFGEIVDVNLIRDKKTGKSRGFAFLAYTRTFARARSLMRHNEPFLLRAALLLQQSLQYVIVAVAMAAMRMAAAALTSSCHR